MILWHFRSKDGIIEPNLRAEMEDFKVNLLQQKEAEIKALKSQLKKQADEIASLKKQNEWYIEQLKLRQKQKFGVSSEKADENQMT